MSSKNKIKNYATIFFYGFLQVMFVTMNVFFISQKNGTGSFFTSIIIGIIWTTAVKRISVCSIQESFCYALGSATGNTIGIQAAKYITEFLFANQL